MTRPAPEVSLEEACGWPAKVDVLGIGISVTDYDRATHAIVEAALQRRAAIVSCHAVHAVVTLSRTRDLKRISNTFEMITPDGQPVRWVMNHFYSAKLNDRVYGPELMMRICQSAAKHDISIALVGGAPDTLTRLSSRLKEQFDGLNVVDEISPPFRPLADKDLRSIAQRLESRGAQIVFLGLGCPKQDLFAHRLRPLVNTVQVCVGAAFDLHAGDRAMAPDWMQRNGLEWLFRLSQEPTRLWKRYLFTNSEFVLRVFASHLFRRHEPISHTLESSIARRSS